MTTIAWDGRTLAADRRCICAGLKSRMRKIWTSKLWVYAGAGPRPDLMDIARWLERGARNDERPTLEEGGCCGLAVRRTNGHVYRVEGKRPALCRINEPFASDGSGRDYALAAMALGKTAREAVALAARFDVSTGGGIDSVVVVPR